MTKKIVNKIEEKIIKIRGGNKDYEKLLRERFFDDNKIGSAVIEAETKSNSEITELISEITRLKGKITWLESEKGVLKRDLEKQTDALQTEVDGLYREREIWL